MYREKKRRSLQKEKQRRGEGLPLQHQLTLHSPSSTLSQRPYPLSLRDRRSQSSKALPRASPRAQTAWQTPLGDTGKPEGALRVRTASLVHLEALTSSSPPPHRHLTSSGHPGRTPSQTAGKMASLVTTAALASSWSQPGLHSSRGSPSSSQDRPKAA